MSDPLFMEPVKGSQVLLHSKGRFFESLAYVHGGRLYARHGSAFMAMRPATASPSGAFVSDSNFTVETFTLPDRLRAVTTGGFLALPAVA